MISLQHLVEMRRKVAAVPAGQFETMDSAKWKQTAIDVPLVALAAGAGYGISKTVADRIASKRLAQGQAFSPATKKYLPIGLAIGNALMGYGVARLREEAKARRGVRSELQRMAEKRASGVRSPKDVKTRALLQEKMRAGDIILMSAEKLKDPSLFNKIYQEGYNRVQGRWAHAAIYDGRGKVMEVGDPGLQHRKLDAATKNRDVLILRPEVPKKKAEAAAARALQIVDEKKRKVQYSSNPFFTKVVAKLVLPDRMFNGAHEAEIERDRFICSNFVSHVYKDKVDFHPTKARGYITPNDLLRSDKVKTVLEYKNPALKTAGVEPAPQSRGIPKKKPSDPWAYDPRPTFEL